MQSRQDRFIHELSLNHLIDALHQNPWCVQNQSLNSAVTNDNDLPEPNAQWQALGENTAGVNAFADIHFGSGVKRMLDVGGGQFNHNRDYMKRENNIELLVWDPYNRSAQHNAQIKAAVMAQKVDAVTSMSVLNVIPDIEARLAHMVTLKSALVMHGQAYLKIWPGEGWLKGSYLPSATQIAYQANAYAHRFLHEVEAVFGLGNVILDKTIPNLIVAQKRSESLPCLTELVCVQKKSASVALRLAGVRAKSMVRITTGSHLLGFFAKGLSWYEKLEEAFVVEHRHANAELQQAYDRKHGLSRK